MRNLPIKKLQGFGWGGGGREGGRSGLELTDTLLHARSNYFLKTVEVSFRTDIFQILTIGLFPHFIEKYLSLNFFGHPFWSNWGVISRKPAHKIAKSKYFEKFKLNRNLQTIPFNPIHTGGLGVFSTSKPVNCSKLQNETSYNLETW